jgi:tetratricopeptide (TPR) repeat protein
MQQALANEFPESAKYRSALAGTEHNLATLLLITRRLPEAEHALRRALEHRRRLAEEFPQEVGYRQDLARTQHNLGRVLELAGRPKDAEPAYRQAMDLLAPLAEGFPRDPAYRRELAGAHSGLAGMLEETGQFADAETEYAQALALQQRLTEDFPRVPAYRQELAHTHNNIGMLLARRRSGDAEQAYRRALDLQQRLVDESPGVPALLNELGRTSANLAELLLQQDRPAEARELAERAVRHQQAALKLLPRNSAYARHLAHHFRVLAEARLQLGDHAAAAQAVAEMPHPSAYDARLDLFAATVLARCIPLVEQDSTLTAENRQPLAESYGERAVTLIRQSLRSRSASDLPRLKSDPNLAPLRQRADFQKLLGELEQAGGPNDK